MSDTKKKLYQAEIPIIAGLKANKPGRKNGETSPSGFPSNQGGSSNGAAGSGHEREEIILRLIEFFSKS